MTDNGLGDSEGANSLGRHEHQLDGLLAILDDSSRHDAHDHMMEGTTSSDTSDVEMETPQDDPSDVYMGSSGVGAGDGTAERSKKPKRKAVASIYIHAGAGYHSVANERTHLEVCSDAARVAMKYLKEGGSAVDAVEAAIRLLEAKEITNAGYGSNLSMDGIVECDATIVDHRGRSGACGAVPSVKFPISLARTILDYSSQPLTLRRVPPNLLVGPGATKFAFQHGLTTVQNEFMISKHAMERYQRWKEDLARVEARLQRDASAATPPPPPPYDADPAPAPEVSDHVNAIYSATFNEGQPDSPQMSGAMPCDPARLQDRPPTPQQAASEATAKSEVTPRMPARSPAPLSENPPAWRTPPAQGALKPLTYSSVLSSPWSSRASGGGRRDAQHHDGPRSEGPNPNISWAGRNTPFLSLPDEDIVNDTVGAIAVDMLGNIAAASSSGGIGMKHSGRCGPAALVGVGTAVVPVHPEDEDEVSVAAVTSGTGEHMATTTASRTCAEHLYHNYKTGPNGQMTTEYNEDAIMEAFIIDDFMGHPGVENELTKGAIGIMAVKKTRRGHYLYFAHNTDSFALASMSSNDTVPLVVMSRLSAEGSIARGGRKIST